MPDPVRASSSSLMCENWPDATAPLADKSSPALAESPGTAADDGHLSEGVVWLCHRVAHLPLAEAAGLEHWWLMTPTREAGMGGCGEGVPGNHVDSPYLTETCVNDHAGEHEQDDVSCFPLQDVDPTCVDAQLELGRPLGPWRADNQCHSFVENTVAACVPKQEEIFDGAEGAPGRYDSGSR